jgi:cytoskeleton protein RodZ
MSDLGSYLSGLRKRRGLSIEEMARSTRVAPRYLEALEADSAEVLPAPVFVRGFIRAYCQVLGVAPDEALARYDGRSSEPPAPAARSVSTVPPAENRPRSRGPVLVSFVLLVVLGLALFAVTIVLQPGREHGEEQRAGVPATEAPEARLQTAPLGSSSENQAGAEAPPTASDARAPAEARPVEPEPRMLVPDPRQTATISPSDLVSRVGSVTSPYRLLARASEPTWIRVRMDDGRLTEETIPAGQVREWVSNSPFVITVGNAGGVILELNGRELPPLGARGAVISRLVIPPIQQ